MATATLVANYGNAEGVHLSETSSDEEEAAFDTWTDLVLAGLDSDITKVTSLTANLVRDDGETLELTILFGEQPVEAECETTEQEEETV